MDVDLHSHEKIASEISVVIISYRWRATLLDAVRSICEQDVRPEIVVVGSGGGDVARRLAAAGIDVRVIEFEDRLLPGGARNAGIEATNGKYVAFLADDCIATPGWVRVRLGAHRNGAAAVGSALLCHKPTNVVALAAHLSLFSRRMPRIPPREALAYGASYDRRLFAENGLFRDDIEGGEDTEFHRRLAEPDKPEWHPEVRTIHVGCEKLGSFLADQFRRGRRSADAWREIGTMGSGSVAKAAIRRNRFIVGNALTVVEPHQRWAARLAIPLIVMGSIAYAAGALASGFSRAGAQADRGRQST